MLPSTVPYSLSTELCDAFMYKQFCRPQLAEMLLTNRRQAHGGLDGGEHTRTVAEADGPQTATIPVKMKASASALYSMKVSRCSVLDTVDPLITREAFKAKNT